MKTLLIGALTFSFLSAFAQTEPTAAASRTLFKVSPQNFTQNTLKLGFERFNKKFSNSYLLYLTGMVDNDAHEDMYADNYGYDGFGAEFQFRRYVSPLTQYTTKRGRNYYQGIYLSGYVQAGHYSGDRMYETYTPNPDGGYFYTDFQVNEDIGNYGMGFTIGVQRTLWNIIFFDLFIGGGVQLSDIIRSGKLPDAMYFADYRTITDPGYQGIMPKIGLHIGLGL